MYKVLYKDYLIELLTCMFVMGNSSYVLFWNIKTLLQLLMYQKYLLVACNRQAQIQAGISQSQFGQTLAIGQLELEISVFRS